MKCCEQKAGQLRNRIELQAKARVSDGSGGWVDDWATYATVWAKIQPLSGTEGIFGMQLQDTISHDIIIRYRSGVSPEHRVKYGLRLFNIRQVLNIEERNKWLDIRAEEGVAT